MSNKMTVTERLRAAWIILTTPHIERVDLSWTRPDGGRASRIWVGIR